jgi:hypothetical protein
MGIRQLVQPGVHWGPIAGFTLVGAAIGVTGAFIHGKTNNSVKRAQHHAGPD